MREIFLQVLEHPGLILRWLHYCRLWSFYHVLHPLASPEFSHVVHHSDLEAISIEVVIIRMLDLDHQDQRIIYDVALAEVLKRRCQILKHVVLAENWFTLAVDQKVDI